MDEKKSVITVASHEDDQFVEIYEIHVSQQGATVAKTEIIWRTRTNLWKLLKKKYYNFYKIRELYYL